MQSQSGIIGGIYIPNGQQLEFQNRCIVPKSQFEESDEVIVQIAHGRSGYTRANREIVTIQYMFDRKDVLEGDVRPPIVGLREIGSISRKS